MGVCPSVEQARHLQALANPDRPPPRGNPCFAHGSNSRVEFTSQQTTKENGKLP